MNCYTIFSLFLTTSIVAGSTRAADHHNLWFLETEGHRHEASRAIAAHDANCSASNEFGPLISEHRFGHGFATMQEAALERQTQRVQTTLSFSNANAKKASTADEPVTAAQQTVHKAVTAAQQINELLTRVHAAATTTSPLPDNSRAGLLGRGNKDALADMYLEEGGFGFQRKIAPTGVRAASNSALINPLHHSLLPYLACCVVPC